MSGWAETAPTSQARRRAARRNSRRRPPAPVRMRWSAAKRVYHDSFILKFSPDGKFLGEIGKANGSQGSLDTKM